MHPGKTDIESVLAAIGRAQAPEGLHERIMRACGTVEPVAEITCEQCLELASAYVDDELPPAERDLFEGHVFICSSCYATFRRLQRASDVLRETPAAVAPAGLDARIRAAVAREAAAEPTPNFAWRRTAAVLGGLAAAAALLAAVFVPRGGGGLPSGDPLIAETPGVAGDSVAGALEADGAAAAAEPAEVAENIVGDAVTAATASEPAANATAPRTTVRETPRPRRMDPVMVAHNPPAAPAVEDAAPRHELRIDQPAPVRPQPERAAPRRRTEHQPAVTPTPRPAPRPQPVIAEQPPRLDPVAPATAVSTPVPPGHAVTPRESAVAALPSQSAPAPVSTPPAVAPSAASPRPAASEPVAVRTASRGGSSRVIPTQPRSRTVFQSEEAPAGELRSRMAGRINGSVSSLDRATSGIQLN